MAISKVAFGSFSSGQFGNESVIGFTAQSAAGKQGEEKKKKSEYLLLKMFQIFCTLATMSSYSPCTHYYYTRWVAHLPYSAMETNLIVEKKNNSSLEVVARK